MYVFSQYMWRDTIPPHVSEYAIILSIRELYRYFRNVAKDIFDTRDYS